MSYNPGNYNEERKMNTQNLSREFKFNFLLAKKSFLFCWDLQNTPIKMWLSIIITYKQTNKNTTFYDTLKDSF